MTITGSVNMPNNSCFILGNILLLCLDTTDLRPCLISMYIFIYMLFIILIKIPNAEIMTCLTGDIIYMEWIQDKKLSFLLK